MDLRIVLLVGWCLLVGRVWSQKAINGELTIPNNNVCADTLIGTDYTGKLTVTGSGSRCRHWSPIAIQIPVPNADSTFPDRTVLEASNYCRNPYQFGTFNSPGFPTYRQQPFCFVGTSGNAEELCDIPLCGVPDEREVCNHRRRSPPSGVSLKTCSCSVNAIASNINKHFLTVDYLYKVLPNTNCDLKAGLEVLRIPKDQNEICENGAVFNVTENAAVYVQNVKAYFVGQLTDALYEYKISYAGYKSVSLLQCNNPEWSFSAFWQTVVTEQTNRFWKIHIEFVEPTPTVQPSSPANTGTDGVSSTGTGTVVSSTDIVSSTSVSIPTSVQSSTGGTDPSVTSAFTESSTPVQSSTETVAPTSASSQSVSSSDNTIQPSSSPGDQSSSVQSGTSAGTETVQPSSTTGTETVQPSSSAGTETVQPSSSTQPNSSGTQTAQPSSSETTPLSTTGGTAQSTAGTVASSVTSPQSSATSSVQTTGSGSVDSSTSGGGSDQSSGAQSTDSVRTTGTAQSTGTGSGINPSATQTSSTGTGVTATTGGTATGTPPSSYTPGVTTAPPKMEINDEEWKLAVGLGVAMCILFILGILLACFIIHVCCCKERAKRRRELYYAAQLQAEKDSPQGNGVLPTITVTSVPDGKPLEIITSNEDGQSLSSANPNDVEIDIPNDDIDEPGYATIRKPDADTPSLASDVDPAYATIQRAEPPPVPPKMDGVDVAETAIVTAAVVTNGVDNKTASRRGSESDSIKLTAHESSHHPDVLLANKHVTIGDDKHVRISANGRVKEIPRPLVVPPSDNERKKSGKPRAYSSLPRVRHAENATVHSYSPSYTVVTPHRQRQFATNNNLRYVSSPPRSPVFLVRGQAGPVVAGGQNIPMRGLVLRAAAPARPPGRYRKRSQPGHSSMRSSRSAEFGHL